MNILLLYLTGFNYCTQHVVLSLSQTLDDKPNQFFYIYIIEGIIKY